MHTHPIRHLAAALCAAATLPASAADAEDAYIANEGLCGLDTGYYVKPTTRVELDFELLEAENNTDADWYILDERSMEGGAPANTHYFNLYFVKTSGSNANKFGWSCVASASNAYKTTGVPGDTKRHLAVIDAKKGKGYFYTEGDLAKEYDFPDVFTTPIPGNTLKLFGRYNFTGASFPKAKIYGFKIFEYTNATDKVLVRDYIPAVKCGVVGLYDTVAGGFLSNGRNASGNNSIGVFAAGGTLPEVPDDPCIISDGTPKTGINTGVCYGSDTRIEVDYAFTSTNRFQMRICGYDGVSPRASLYIQGTGKVAFGFDNAEHSAFAATTTDFWNDTLRHTAIVDQPGGSAYYITCGVTNKTVTIPSMPTADAKVPLSILGNTSGKGLTMTFAEGTPPNYNAPMARVYGMKIWKGGTLVRNLEPLVRGGVPGFLDKVTGAFLTAENNEQLAAFSASPATTAVPDDPFVALPGNNSTIGGKLAFNTGYVPNNATRVELDFAQYAAYPTNGYSGNHNWYLFHADAKFNMYFNKSGMGWSAGNSWLGFSPGVSTARSQDKDVRRTAILDMQNLSAPASLVTAGYTNCVSASAGTSISLTKPLFLAANTDTNSTGALKIYGCRIFENGTLVHSFEPRVQGGMAGLFDTHGDKGFISAARTDTAANVTPGGSLAPVDAYIASSTTDKFSVNTGYLIGPNTRIDADFSFLARTADVSPMETLKYQQFVFEAGSQSTIMSRIYLNGQDGTGAIAWSFNKPYNWTGSSQTMVPGVRYTMSIAGNGTTGTAVLKVNGIQKYTASTNLVGATATTTALRLFSNAAGTGNWAMMRLYSFRIYELENGNYALKREFLPYTDGTRVGLYDTVDGGKYFNVVSGSPDFTMSGMGVDGAEKWVKALPATAEVPVEGTATLTAAAAGAIRYKWAKNGAVIAGATGESITATWRQGGYGTPDTYTCTAIYDVFGVETEGAPVACEVSRIPPAFVIVVR